MHVASRTRTWGTIAAGSAVLVVLTGLPASADDSSSADATAELIAAVAPTEVSVLDTQQVPTVAIPDSPDGVVVLSDANGSVPSISLTLPDETSLADAQTAEDGTVVYPGVGASADVAVQVIDDRAVQIQTVLDDPTAGTEFTYSFGEEVTPVIQDDGSALLVVGVDQDVSVVLGEVAAPWAVDATGQPVDTAYSVVDGDLVQVIAPDADTTYPIVADPTVTLGTGIYVYYSKSEVKSIAGSSIADKIKYVSALCSVIPNPVAAAGCALYVYDSYDSVADTFKSAAKAGKRVEMKYTYSGLLIGWKPVA